MSVQISNTVSKKARRDISELQEKIDGFQAGKLEEDKFKHFRLTRGVYGQRQTGVQMIRIKLPYGKVTAAQLDKIAEVSDKYSNGKLHITTRQNIQLHYVKLNDSPALWAELEEENITLREACGNTVRNITASPNAGIDPKEPFDVTAYAHGFFTYFLRNPIGQDMGRKIKIAFSSSVEDTAFTYFHDFGFVPQVKEVKGKSVRGFKVVVGGGLGAQAFVAKTVYEFLEEDRIIPFTEAAIRVFDRYGEREKRLKARLKYLIQKMGLETFLNLVKKEEKSLSEKRYKIDTTEVHPVSIAEKGVIPAVTLDKDKFDEWVSTNVFEQKQKGYYGVQIRVPLGNITSDTARKISALVRKYATDDIRFTIDQGILLKYATKETLRAIYYELEKLHLALPGFGTIHDITTCPGSDTCNLAVTNSTGLTLALEQVLKDEYNDLIGETGIRIKISGCMNSCGQHMAANIGFHGSSIKNGALVAPAMQVVLGGGFDLDHQGSFADKVIKLPTKKATDALRYLLNDFEERAVEGEYFNDYYHRLGKDHFYQLLKPLADKEQFSNTDYLDWGNTEQFKPVIGVGECAGVSLDVIGTIIDEAEERIVLAGEGLQEQAYADALYNSYSAFVIGAKALLLSIDVKCNTRIRILSDFDKHFVNAGKVFFLTSFESTVLKINENAPTKEFAETYFEQALDFLRRVKVLRENQLSASESGEEKQVVDSYYKA